MANKTVLVVDDHSDIRQLIRITLGRGFDVLEAGDATTALQVIRTERPYVVVLDVMMPGEMNGMGLLKLIKGDESLRSTHVIMVTARGQTKDREEGIAAGADAYFVKPFSPIQLAGMVRDLCR